MFKRRRRIRVAMGTRKVFVLPRWLVDELSADSPTVVLRTAAGLHLVTRNGSTEAEITSSGHGGNLHSRLWQRQTRYQHNIQQQDSTPHLNFVTAALRFCCPLQQRSALLGLLTFRAANCHVIKSVYNSPICTSGQSGWRTSTLLHGGLWP